MLPPAPARFSTTTGWPERRLQLRRRAGAPTGPPGRRRRRARRGAAAGSASPAPAAVPAQRRQGREEQERASRLLRLLRRTPPRASCGSPAAPRSPAAAPRRSSSPALIGRVTNTLGSPRDSSSARRRFSSIIGPRMKPSSSGAGSQLELDEDVADDAEDRHHADVEGVVVERCTRRCSRTAGSPGTGSGRAPSAA